MRWPRLVAGSMGLALAASGLACDAPPEVSTEPSPLDDAGLGDAEVPGDDAAPTVLRWSAPLFLASLGERDVTVAPSVAVNRLGAAVAAVHTTDALLAVRLPRDEAVEAPTHLGATYGRGAFVDLDDGGGVVIAAGGPYMKTYEPGLGWTAEEDVGYFGTSTGVDVASDGRVLVALGRSGQTESPEGSPFLAIRAPGGTWTIQRTYRCMYCSVITGDVALSDVADYYVFPAAIAPYIPMVPGRKPYEVRVSTNLPNAGELVVADTFSYVGVDAAISDAGLAIVTMQQEPHGGEQHVMVSTYTYGWEAPMAVDTGGGLAAASAVDMDPQGNAVVAWRECGATCAIWVRRFVDRAWQAPETLSEQGLDVRASATVDVACDEHGRCLAVWSQPYHPLYTIWTHIVVSELVDGAWSEPHTLTATPGERRAPGVDFSGDHGVAVWIANDRELHGARYRP